MENQDQEGRERLERLLLDEPRGEGGRSRLEAISAMGGEFELVS